MAAEDWLSILKNLSGHKENPKYIFLEGRILVERYLNAGFRILFCLGVKEALDKLSHYKNIDTICQKTEAELKEIVGFKFHRGLIAIAQKPEIPSLVEEFGACDAQGLSGCADTPNRLVVCPSITDPGNLGTIIRNADAFGWEGVAVGDTSTDPFNRKAMRASMGSIFNVDLYKIESPDDLDVLRLFGYVIIAAVPDQGADKLEETVLQVHKLETLHGCGQKVALVLGHEHDGLIDDWIHKSDRRVCIPMLRRVDSLNVAQAAGILMYRLSPLLI